MLCIPAFHPPLPPQVACERLQLQVAEETLAEFSTLSGFLCHVAGEIPDESDVLLVSGLRFEVQEADERRLLLVQVRNITSSEDDDFSHAQDAS